MSTKKLVLLILLFLFTNLLKAKDVDGDPFFTQIKNFQSIHQIQSNKYKNVKPLPLKSEQYYKMHSKEATSTPRVKKQVLGYYTYWKTGTSNIQWDLLTILAYFSVDINSSGNITDLHGWPSSAPINEAHSHGVKVILTATLFGYDSIRTLIQSPTNRQNCIQNLFNQVQSAGADGICIDFELPYSSDREYFNTFIQELSDYFHTNLPDSLVVVDTPAVNWNDRMDFNTLTDYADYLFIMAYDYHYRGGDPGPVSPLSYTSGSPWPTWAGIVQTLDDYINGTYGVGNAKKSKLILGVPYYGYDWPAQDCTIPTEQRDDASAVIYSTAVDKAAQYNREWDNYSQTPFYDYNCSTSYPHQAWYDDDVSLGLKYDKVNEYNIGGTGMWALNYDGTRPELWQKLREKFGFLLITATAEAGGSITPSGNVQVDYGDNMSFTITANASYVIKQLLVDGSEVADAAGQTTYTYTFTNVTADHTISATFVLKTYTITANAGANGAITPSGNVTVNCGSNQSFTITANATYVIDELKVDGNVVSLASNQSTYIYTFTNITSNHTINVTFKANLYTVTATAGAGGSINPSGDVSVTSGDSITFTITPDSGYHIKDVLVDGSNIGAVSTYTFGNVTANHTIEAQFEQDAPTTYTITATAGTGGSINPNGSISVNSGDSITFTITPDIGYFINDVIVDSQSVGRVNTYTFTDVYSNHRIEASFSTSLPPIITDAEADSLNNSLPINATFTCNAYDPDGGNIVQYIWHIDGENFSDTIATYEGICQYTFIKADSYHISVTVVDDEGETTTAVLKDNSGNDVSITITKPENYNVVIPLAISTSGKSKNINIANSITNILNLSDEMVNLTVNYYDSNGNNVETANYTIEPDGKFTYNPETYNSGNYPYVLMQADNYVLAYTKVITDSGQMASYLLPQYSSKLYIPHIAEETDYWETEMFITSLQSTNLKVNVNTEENQYTIPQFSTTINLEDLLGDNVEEAKTWGTVESVSDNPFGGTQSLNGFEIFQHNGTDGAGVELQSSASTTLFIPHIPEETDIFWTGFAIVNPNDEDANLTVDLYTSEGEKVSTVNLTIPAQSKLKGLASDLFGEAYGNAEWGIIRSDKEIFGIEIYGTVANGICGYSLPSIATTEGYLPELISGENYWNGIAITNPSNEEATVTISLVSSDGIVKMTKEIQLGSMQRFKSVVKDFFEGVDIESTDYIYYHSTTSVLAIEVSGDLDRTFMFSLIGRE